MTFPRSIALLAGVCLCVSFAYFVGHGLSVHSFVPMIWGTGFLIAGAAILAGMSRDRVTW